MLKAPAAAIEACRMELIRMANMSREMVKGAMEVFYKSNRKKIPQILQMEELVDGLEKEINVYLRELSQHSLNPVSYTHLDVYKRQALNRCP